MIKKPKSDPQGCAVDIMAMQDTLELLGGKWHLLIAHYLMQRPSIENTFKKMEKDIEGISAKMLTKVLKDLEANGLVSRTVLETKPVSVNYAITDYGKEVESLIAALVQWGVKHRSKLVANES